MAPAHMHFIDQNGASYLHTSKFSPRWSPVRIGNEETAQHSHIIGKFSFGRKRIRGLASIRVGRLWNAVATSAKFRLEQKILLENHSEKEIV